MQNTELTYQIGLTLLDGIGDVLAKNLLAYCGSAEQIFKTNKAQLEKIPGIGFVLSKSISQSKDVLNRAEKEVLFIQKNNIQPLFFSDKNYPQRLKNCYDSPVMLYYKGNADLNAQKVVSVVGTRTPSPYGKLMTEKLIQDLKTSGILITSGLAYGIDITAHKMALENDLQTVGVIKLPPSFLDSTTISASHIPATILFRFGKFSLSGIVSLIISVSKPPCSTIFSA